jgi:hypothetical protein
MNRSGSFSDNHFISSSDKNTDSFHLSALFNNQHSFIGGSETDFFNGSGISEFIRGDFLESGDNSGTSGHGKKFNILSSNPSNSGKVIN